MEDVIKNFNKFLNEYWGSSAPGTVIVPGEWYKDSVNKRNYKPSNTTMPHIVDPILEDSEFISILDAIRDDEKTLDELSSVSDPLEILNIIEKFIKLKRS